MTNQYKLTDNQKQLLLTYFKSEDFFDELESYITDYVILNADLNDILEEYTDLHVYGATNSGYPLVTNVKTHIGWNDNNITNSIEQFLLKLFIDTQYDWGNISEHEFEYMAESYKDIGELVCVGRSGGYWGFKEIDFKFYTNPWNREQKDYDSSKSYELIPKTQYIIDVLCNDLEYYARDYLCINENYFYIDDDTELEELNFQQNCLGGSLLDAESVLDKLRFEVTDMFEVNQHLIDRLQSFHKDCRSLVEYWENAENCIQEYIDSSVILKYLFLDILNLNVELNKYTFKGANYNLTMDGLDDNVAVSYDKLTNQITLEDNINIETFRLKEELLTQILNSVREHYSSVHTY